MQDKNKRIVRNNILVNKAPSSSEMPDYSMCKQSSCPQPISSYEPSPKKHCPTGAVCDKYIQTGNVPTKQEKELKRKVKVLSQRLKRRDTKIKDLSSMLDFIKHMCNNFDEV